MTKIGVARAVSFTQYWKACTKVIERMPPAATLITTITATIAAPTWVGAPVTVCTARPAPCNWGSR
jgi:hypothetical protein